MLVLSRQRDETIMIGDNVEITVVDIRGDKVRLGITAPRQIQVHRKEVYEAIKRENQQAAKLKPQDVSDLAEGDADNKKAGKKASVGDRLKPVAESDRHTHVQPPPDTAEGRSEKRSSGEERDRRAQRSDDADRPA